MKATPGHGVRAPERPTLNLFVADEAWVTAYATAAETRNLRHGLLIRRSALVYLAERPGYELRDVIPRYPHNPGEFHEATSWHFDHPSHRPRALDTMCRSTVVRLATPPEDGARYIDISNDAIRAWW